jgi:hypothetical protein
MATLGTSLPPRASFCSNRWSKGIEGGAVSTTTSLSVVAQRGRGVGRDVLYTRRVGVLSGGINGKPIKSYANICLEDGPVVDGDDGFYDVCMS